MKNKWRRLLISIAVLTLLNVIPAYASEVFYWNGMEWKYKTPVKNQ